MFRSIWNTFRKSELGQDLSEYCLITAIVALVALGIFVHLSGGIQSIWGNADTALTAGSSAVPPSGGAVASPAVASSPAGH